MTLFRTAVIAGALFLTLGTSLVSQVPVLIPITNP